MASLGVGASLASRGRQQANLSTHGQDQERQAMDELGTAAAMETQRKNQNRAMEAQAKQGNQALGGTLGGLAGGAAAGAMYGTAAGPWGTLIGGVLGALAGGLF